MDIFSLLLPKYKMDKDKKIRLITLFSGYDSQKLAFNYIGVDVEHYRAIEFDKYAMQSLNEIHNTNFETKDITKVSADELGIVDTENITYIMTYSFPCTDLSLAGKRAGMDRESGTRSGLLWEVERLLLECKELGNLPNCLIMENVPQVITANGWREWNVFLENLGYSNYCQILNAKDYGIPQNRERCFMVSILGEYSYEFPKPFELKDRLKDFLENDVDEKYYLSEKTLQRISNWKAQQDPLKDIEKEKNVSPTLTARGAGEEHSGMILINENLYNNQNMKAKLCNDLIENQGNITVIVYDDYNSEVRKDQETIGTITTNIGNNAPRNGYKIIEIEKPKLIGGFGEMKSNGGTQWYQQDRVYDSENVAMCHCANIPSGSYNYQVKEKRKSCYNCKHFCYDTFCGFNNPMCSKYGSLYDKERICDNCLDYEETKNIEYEDLTNLRIRKLTPCECFKLMGVKPSDYSKITCSNAQKYKQAGNSIVTTCLMAIYSQLFENVDYKYYIEELLKELRTN